MARGAMSGNGWRGSYWRIAAWSAAALLLLLPLVAMQFTDEVHWTTADFVVFGAMLACAGGAFELAARMTLIWPIAPLSASRSRPRSFSSGANGAVGIIGSEDNPANLMFGGVLAVGLVGAVVARFRPQGMVRALVATALAQALVAVVAAVAGMGYIFVATAFFGALWLGSAWLFRRAALQQAVPRVRCRRFERRRLPQGTGFERGVRREKAMTPEQILRYNETGEPWPAALAAGYRRRAVRLPVGAGGPRAAHRAR